MGSKLNQFSFIALLAISAIAGSGAAAIADPAAGGGSGASVSSLTQFHQELAERRGKLITKLSSSDPSQVEEAIAEVDDWSKNILPSRRAELLDLLVDTKHYPEAEERAVAYILHSASDNWAIDKLQKMRVHSFIRQGMSAQALSAAKAYYDACLFEKTKDAISLVSLCLLMAHPDDKTIARRFRDQQVAWASTPEAPSAPIQAQGSTTQPAQADAALAAATAKPAPSAPVNPPATPLANPLGDPILPTISIDPSPFEAAVQEMPEDSYRSLASKGNLLLLCGRADDAKVIFDRAYDVASDEQLPNAIENVARAIRAQTGSVGMANEYLKSVQQPQGGSGAAPSGSGVK